MLETANILTGALSQALETMAFMEILPVEKDAPVPDETLCADISFSGPQCGRIQILAARALAETLAETFGALDEVSEADCRDALKELANVTCGLVTPVIADDMSEVFELSIPVIRDQDETLAWQSWAEDPQACVLDVEGHLMAAKLALRD